MTEELISRADFEAWFRMGAVLLAGLIFVFMGLEGIWKKRPTFWILIRALAYSGIPVLILGLLKVYGLILDRYGLDRIAALTACATIFVVSGILVGGALGLMEKIMGSRLRQDSDSKAL